MNETQRIFLEEQQDTYLPILAESFLVDRRAAGLSPGTLKFYRDKIRIFLDYCEAQAVRQLADLTPDFLRRFMLALSEGHNPGGAHAVYRTLRALLRWAEAEGVLPGWKNPIAHLKAPRVAQEPIEPVSLDDVAAMLRTCKVDFVGKRDHALILALLDTGARAAELLALDIDDLDLAASELLIRQGKGRKPRTVFIGRRTRRALRAYLRLRHDHCRALWATVHRERLTYDGLRAVFTRRARLAGLASIPSPHDFRRQFALSMLRNGADIFSLQKLMGHAGLQMLRRYLAQTDQDTRAAHALASPADKL